MIPFLCFSVPLHLWDTLFSFSFFAHAAAISPATAMQWRKMPQQRQSRLLSPHLCHNGGASCVCRRFLWRKIRTIAAVPVFAAVHYGDNFANLRH